MSRTRLFRNHATPFLPTDAPNLYYWHDMSSAQLWGGYKEDGVDLLLIKDLSNNPINKNLENTGLVKPNPIYKKNYLSLLDAAVLTYNECPIYTLVPPASGETSSWYDLGFFWAIAVRIDIFTFNGVDKVMCFAGPDEKDDNISMGYNQQKGGFFRAKDGTRTMTIYNVSILPGYGSIVGPEGFPPNIIWSYKKPQSYYLNWGSNTFVASYDTKSYGLQTIAYRGIGVNGTVSDNNGAGIIFGEQVFYLGNIPESTTRTCLDYMMRKWTGTGITNAKIPIRSDSGVPA